MTHNYALGRVGGMDGPRQTCKVNFLASDRIMEHNSLKRSTYRVGLASAGANRQGKVSFSRARVISKARGRRALQELLDNKDEEEDRLESEMPVLKGPVTWESPLSVVKYPDPLLRAPNATIECFDENLAKLAEEMFEVMYEDDGVGLAAPQVGVNVRMMVFNETGEREHPEAQVVLVNPKIVTASKGTSVFEEGCLSFPKLYGDVVVRLIWSKLHLVYSVLLYFMFWIHNGCVTLCCAETEQSTSESTGFERQVLLYQYR